MLNIKPELLGSKEFKEDYGIKYAYVAGAMYKGIASADLVIQMGNANLLSFLGTGGLTLTKIEEYIKRIQQELNNGQPYGMNLLCNISEPEIENQTVALFLAHNIKCIEAAAYMQITPAIVYFRIKGIHEDASSNIIVPHQIMAKVSRPETAQLFMSPPPKLIVTQLLNMGKITAQEAKLAENVPLSHDICLEADSGGHTDQRVATTLIPSILKLREHIMNTYRFKKRIRIGAAGGIGTPEAIAAAFIMGADFVLTGSINQCTVEAGNSEAVKNILQEIDIQDTSYAPAGDMFEIGARMQVVRKGLLFPARANKLYDLYTHHQSLEEIDEHTKKILQENYFKRSFEEIWEETKVYYMKKNSLIVEKAEKNPKHKMALIFRWYFIHTTRLALKGSNEQQSDYQIHCGSALGAFNQFVKGTTLENWRNRHVDEIGTLLMTEAANLLNKRFSEWD